MLTLLTVNTWKAHETIMGKLAKPDETDTENLQILENYTSEGVHILHVSK